MPFDYVLVGAGLQSSLIALAVLASKPHARVAVVEREATPGGNHLWCFHAGDLHPSLERVVEPLVVKRWAQYDVAFPNVERRVDAPYAAVTSERLATVLSSTLRERSGSALVLGREVVSVEADHAAFIDGQKIFGRLVIDARGPDRFLPASPVAFQKFLGLELTLETPSPRLTPLLMDARVEQRDGFRFFYVLPFSTRRVLIEETFFADGPELDREALRASIFAYAREAGYRVARVEREECGVLPLPWAPPRIERSAPLQAGYQGGWFHPTTGYSFPVAARLAQHVAAHEPENVTGDGLDRLASEHTRQLRFACFLNRLLFASCPPEHRVDVLEHFYQLPEATIRRFYSLTTNMTDRARIVCGKPPRGVSVGAAITRGVLS